MAKTKKEEVVEKTTDEAVETKGATEDGKLKVKKKKPSMKSTEISDEPIKVDLSKPVEKSKEEPKEEPKDEVKEEVKEEENTETPVLEEITDAVSEEKEETQDKEVEEVREEVKEAVETSKETGVDLPENFQKAVDFMNETGGDLDDYVKLNQDYSKLDDKTLLREYYNQTKPHLASDEIDFLIEDRFDYDEDVDEPVDIKRKKLAFKEQVADAKTHLDGLKSKYYAEIKAGSKLNPEQQKAIDFFNRYNEKQEQVEEQRSTFNQKTDEVFDDKFKGFEYNVGDKRFRVNVKDVNEVKTEQSDISNFVSKFLNKRNVMENAIGYHKALYTAENSDSIAKHFYEQGKADALKESVAKSKNIDMTPRTEHGEVTTGGMKVRVVDDSNSSSKLRFKIRK